VHTFESRALWMQRQILCKSSSKLDVHNAINGGGGGGEPLEGLKRKAQFILTMYILGATMLYSEIINTNSCTVLFVCWLVLRHVSA
jgi:predicted Abi (CAAX) family protease